DLAPQVRLHLENGVAKRLALDEIVGQLVEWSVEIIIDLDIFTVGADQDFSVAPPIAIKHEARALPDQDTVAFRVAEKVVGNVYGFVEDVEKVIDRGIRLGRIERLNRQKSAR